MAGVRSMFCVWNNPEDIIVRDNDGNEIERLPSEYKGLEPQEICDLALESWTSSKKGRYGWVGYCISKNNLHHLHMVLESKNQIDFPSVKKVFPRAHISMTYGNKKQVEDYINKRGEFEEKGEIVVCHASVGDIKGNQGKRSDLQMIEEELMLGKKPKEIIGTSVKRQRYASMIQSAYFAKREAETPIERPVFVYWHYGKPGTGKSYSFVQLCNKYGRDNVYKIERDLGKGRFDDYQGEKILFIDELKPNCCDWVELLNCLDKYIYRPSARYRNSLSLWEEVHITSVYSPKEYWEQKFDPQERTSEPFFQLERRIDVVKRHWIDDDGRYRQTDANSAYLDPEEVISDVKALPFK